jgi:hypothetical protein
MGNLAWFTGGIIKRVYKLKNTKFKVANLKKITQFKIYLEK